MIRVAAILSRADGNVNAQTVAMSIDAVSFWSVCINWTVFFVSFVDFILTFQPGTGKIDSVWCAQQGVRSAAFHKSGVCRGLRIASWRLFAYVSAFRAADFTNLTHGAHCATSLQMPYSIKEVC